MYLRIRQLDPEDVKTGEKCIVTATTLEGRQIAMRPGVMEWWDGLQWNTVQVVPKDAPNESPWRHS